MSRLDSAFDRFNQAFDRVEGALRDSAKAAKTAKSAKIDGVTRGASDQAFEALRADRDHLARQLEEVRDEYASLQSLTDEVETRLDTTMDNIRKMMRG
jgi:hypothetical protein